MPATTRNYGRFSITVTTDASGDIAARTIKLPLPTEYFAISALALNSSTDTQTTYAITDKDGRSILAAADQNYSTAIVKALKQDAVEASDGAAASDDGVAIFRNPITFDISGGGNALAHVVSFYYEGGFERREAQFTTSAGGAATSVISLGAPYARVYQVFVQNGASDASTDWSIKDGGAATGVPVYVKTSLDADNPSLWLPLTKDAIESSDGAAVTDVGGPQIYRSPLHLTVANGGNALAAKWAVYFKR